MKSKMRKKVTSLILETILQFWSKVTSDQLDKELRKRWNTETLIDNFAEATNSNEMEKKSLRSKESIAICLNTNKVNGMELQQLNKTILVFDNSLLRFAQIKSII